ncbi:hypothetical protein NEF87_004689 [Candidatus Lokiarchaeum ossiferum]|uniref:Glucanase n=1 Tax=Candidatus Lokiarchaeum ossiferum TaxID=2951803 RepID=A0ABY6I128_9ARCH|nr:hypothetical protein NEF87_004689 [Candidatus Lokiarchaeum sp. B-35]
MTLKKKGKIRAFIISLLIIGTVIPVYIYMTNEKDDLPSSLSTDAFITFSNHESLQNWTMTGEKRGISHYPYSLNKRVSDLQSWYTNYVNAYFKPWSISGMEGAYYVDQTGSIFPGDLDPDNYCSTSEGISYGMLISVYMAGTIVNNISARQYFDGLFKTYLACKSENSPANSGLMAWLVPTPAQYGKVSIQGSATDGDLDICYALLLAHLNWEQKDNTTRYFDAAMNLLIRGLPRNIIHDAPNRRYVLTIGDWIKSQLLSNSHLKYSTRFSDYGLDRLLFFHKILLKLEFIDEASLYLKLFQDSISNLEDVRSSGIHSAMVPDFGWIDHLNNGTSIIPAPNGPAFNGEGLYKAYESVGYFLEGGEEWNHDGDLAQNAVRCPWRIGNILDMDFSSKVNGSEVDRYIRDYHSWFENQSNLKGFYDIETGIPPLEENWDDFSHLVMALTTHIYFGNEIQLTNGWDTIMANQGNIGGSGKYFEDNLSLLALLRISGIASWNLDSMVASLNIID